MKTILSAILAATLSLFSAETPDQLRDKGFEALKAAQSDETKTVEAARLLAQAAEAYEKSGNEDAASELNSYLYWCKKRMTLEQTETFARTGDSGRRIAAKLDLVTTRKVEPSDAGKWLERAEAFAKAHPNDSLLCAIRFFEVADRFVGAQESLIAQRKSLDLMGRSKRDVFATFSPIGRWTFLKAKDGKTYVQTFHPDGRFSIENYPIEKYSKGTWRVADGLVIQSVSERESSVITVQDENTMAFGILIYHRVITEKRK